MTEDQKKQQRNQLFGDYYDAEQDLAHLREKARRMAESIYGIAVWLGQGDSQKRRPQEYQGLCERMRANLGHVKATLNADEVISIMEEIQQAEEKLTQLASRKQALLGIKSN
ncbi:MAG TPA: hypothetical protein VHX36_15870 [Candidatus Acidoferrales bacterium]|nr:hypothetical protein [Candidatus Acidoferrales bacterium]